MSSRARERKWLFAIVIFPDKEIVRGIAQRPAHGVKARCFVLVDESGALMPARAGLFRAVVLQDAEAAGVVGGEFPACHAVRLHSTHPRRRSPNRMPAFPAARFRQLLPRPPRPMAKCAPHASHAPSAISRCKPFPQRKSNGK